MSDQATAHMTVAQMRAELKELGRSPMQGESKKAVAEALAAARQAEHGEATDSETVIEPTPEEAENAAQENNGRNHEVRPEELMSGVGRPATTSAWSQEVIDELAKPLDPNRVRRRQQFEYLAGHDVKRRASQIFGFGNWGHRVLKLDELAAVQVNKDGKEGWHVGYRSVVQVWVRVVDLDGRRGDWVTEGVGYGDGVQYTPAARVQACELAIKEAETDGLKRAFTDLGDQFGLILYAKEDEKKRIERDTNTEGATQAVYRQDAPGFPAPRSWAEIVARLRVFGPDDVMLWPEWIDAASRHLYGVQADELEPDVRRLPFFQKVQRFVVLLDEQNSPDVIPPLSQEDIQKVWAQVLNGEVITAENDDDLTPEDDLDIPFPGGES